MEATAREPFRGVARNRPRALPGAPTDFNQHKESFMTTTVLNGPRQQTQAMHRPHPLLSVLAWELRRNISRN